MQRLKNGDYDLVIIGGGIMGLFAAYFISVHSKASRFRIALLEKGEHLAQEATGQSASMVLAQTDSIELTQLSILATQTVFLHRLSNHLPSACAGIFLRCHRLVSPA